MSHSINQAGNNAKNHPMSQHELLRASTRLTQRLVEHTDFDDTTMARPTPCRDYDVAALVEHVIGTHHFLLSAAGVAADDGAAVGMPIAARHRRVADQSALTWAARGSDGTVELGGHELPAEFVLSLHALEAFVHGWDLATALDQPYEPAPELVDAAWAAARIVVTEDSRGTEPGAAYGPAVTVSEQASPLEALIAFTGRRPMARRGGPQE